MEDKELEQLRDLFGGLALAGLIMRGVKPYDGTLAELAYEYADSMMEARLGKSGIASFNQPYKRK